MRGVGRAAGENEEKRQRGNDVRVGEPHRVEAINPLDSSFCCAGEVLDDCRLGQALDQPGERWIPASTLP